MQASEVGIGSALLAARWLVYCPAVKLVQLERWLHTKLTEQEVSLTLAGPYIVIQLK